MVNGEAVKALRIRTGLSVTKLAELTGIDRGNLHRIETGQRRGTPAQLKALADVLQVPLTAIASIPSEASA